VLECTRRYVRPSVNSFSSLDYAGKTNVPLRERISPALFTPERLSPLRNIARSNEEASSCSWMRACGLVPRMLCIIAQATAVAIACMADIPSGQKLSRPWLMNIKASRFSQSLAARTVLHCNLNRYRQLRHKPNRQATPTPSSLTFTHHLTPSATMRLTLPTALLALTLSTPSVSAAPRVEISITTGPGLIPVGSTVLYHADGTKKNFGYFLDGCKSASGIKQFCLDSGNKRGHVTYSDGYKRCFRQTSESSELCGGDEGCYKGVCNRCWKYKYTVAGCNW